MNFFTMFPGDWLSGTAELSPEETGALCNLCCHYIAKDGVVPDDDATIARITKLSTRAWRRVKKRLIEGAFIEIRDGFIWQAKCQDRLKVDGNFASKQREKAEKRRRLHRAKLLENNHTADTAVDATAPTAADAFPYPNKERAAAAAFKGSANKESPWACGLSILTTAGISEKQARSLIGKWRKQLAGDDDRLLNLFLTAQAKSVPDPVAYLTKAVSNATNTTLVPGELSAAEKRAFLESWGMTRTPWAEVSARIEAEGMADRWHRGT
jgi:uncharacterized protein YdaU (DUF1376 family)